MEDDAAVAAPLPALPMPASVDTRTPLCQSKKLSPLTYLLWLLFALQLVTSVHAGEVKVKEVQYRGGLVTFAIPKQWVEEYEPDGGGMFYENSPDTGTLRLNVITAKSPKSLSADAAFEELLAIKGVSRENAQRLANGNAFATSIQHSSERGRDITLFWWHLSHAIRPNHLRIANFSYTVLSSQEASSSVQSEVQLLTKYIKEAKFYSTLGQ